LFNFFKIRFLTYKLGLIYTVFLRNFSTNIFRTEKSKGK